MKKLLKYAGITVGVLAGLLVAVFVVLKLISDDQYKEWITTAVQSATGRDFSIESLAIDLNTSLKVEASDVRMANADWGSKPDMLNVGTLEAEVDLISLLGGVAEVRTVVSQAEVLAESSAEGTSNWALKSGEPTEEEPAAEPDAGTDETGLPIRPLIREFRIEDITLTLIESPEAQARIAKIDKLLVETPKVDTILSVAALLGKVPIELTGNLGLVSDVIDRTSSPLKIDGNVGDTSLAITGRWGPLLPDPNMEVNLNVDIPSTARMLSNFGMTLKELGVAKINVDLAATDGQFSIARALTNMDGEALAMSVEGSISNLLALEGIDFATRIKTGALNRLLENFDIEVPVELPPDVEVSAVVRGSLDGLGVEDINAIVRDKGLEVVVSGTVANALSPEGIDAVVTVKAASTAVLSRYAKLDIPNLGALDISGKIVSADKVIKLDELDTRLVSDNINLSLTGGVSDLVAVSGIDAALSTEISSLTSQNIAEIENLLTQLELEVPLDLLPKSLKFGARAKGDLEKLGVSDINAEVRDEGIVVTLSGAIANVLKVEGIDAAMTFSSENLAVLSKYAQADLPEIGALDVAGKVSSKDRVFSLESLDAKLDAEDFDAAFSASISELRIDELMQEGGLNMDATSGISAELESTINSLASFSELAQTELPETDPIVINANVSDAADGGKRSARATVNVQSAGAKLAVEGLLADLTSVDNLDISILIEADSLSDFNKLAGKELPERGPLKLTGIARARPNEYSLEDFQLTLDDQSAGGFLGIKLAESDSENHLIKGELSIPYLDLSPLLAQAPAEEIPAEQTGATPSVEPATKDVKEEQELAEAEDMEQETTDRLFSKDPLPLEQLRKIDADFSVTAEKLILGKTTLTDFDVVLLLKEGLLRVDPIDSLAGNGTLAGKFILDARSDVAKLGIDMLIDDIPMPNLGGGLDSRIKLDGEGASMADLMGGLDGRLIIVVRDGTIPHGFATNFGSGLFSFSGGKEKTGLECGILRVDIEDGKADFDDQLAVQLTDVTWRGGGDINLKTEKLDVGIAPKPRKGVGISAGSLASLVHVGGTLKNPSVQLDPKDVAVKYGKYMAAVSTGGLSLLAGVLFDKSQANMDVCEAILSGTVFDEDAEGEPEAEGADEGTSAQAESESGGGADEGGSEGQSENTTEKEEPKLVPKNLQ